MLCNLFSDLRNLEEACLDELETFSVVKARRHFKIFVFSQPFFKRLDRLSLMGSKIVPCVEDCAPIVISRNINEIPLGLPVPVADERRHRHGILARVKGVRAIGLAGLRNVFVVLKFVKIFVEGKLFINACAIGLFCLRSRDVD